MKKDVLKWCDSFLLKTAPPFVAFISKLLLNTCHIVHIEGKKISSSCIYVSWHQRMSFFARYLAKEHLVIMISQSRDGEYGARIANYLGFRHVRGSSNRGAVKVLKEIIEYARRGNSIGILADGPLGPPRVAKTGPILIASKSGIPIIPIMWSCTKFWTLNSWDRYMIPKPFSKVVIKIAEPIFVPDKISREEIEFYRKRLQNSLNELVNWCDGYFGVIVPCKKEN